MITKLLGKLNHWLRLLLQPALLITKCLILALLLVGAVNALGYIEAYGLEALIDLIWKGPNGQ